jgi:hypothetical protein
LTSSSYPRATAALNSLRGDSAAVVRLWESLVQSRADVQVLLTELH